MEKMNISDFCIITFYIVYIVPLDLIIKIVGS